jgi:hypothetical protein
LIGAILLHKSKSDKSHVIFPQNGRITSPATERAAKLAVLRDDRLNDGKARRGKHVKFRAFKVTSCNSFGNILSGSE